MPDRMNAPRSGREESTEGIRERQSARHVAEWEAAFRALRPGADPPPTAADGDDARAGPSVSRVHRAEQTGGHSYDE